MWFDSIEARLEKSYNKETWNSQAYYVIKTNWQERDITKQPQSMMGLGYFSLLTYISISVISAVSGPESLPSIPLKNVKQTNKQQQKQKQNLKKGGSVPIKFL